MDLPPFSYLDDNGIPLGFSIDLYRAALEAVGHEPVFNTGPWAELRRRLQTGEVRALVAVARTVDREEVFDFSPSYMSIKSCIVVRYDTEDIHHTSDLQERRVAVIADGVSEEHLQRECPGVILERVTTREDALQEVVQGRADAAVLPRLVAMELINRHGWKKLKLIQRSMDGWKQDLCFAVRKGDVATLELVSAGLDKVQRNGTQHDLEIKWFAATPSTVQPRLIVGGDENYPPFEYLDGKGRPAGFNVELTRAIAQAIGLDVEIRLGPWSEIRDGLLSGEIDAVGGMFYSPERDLLYDFSPPHLVNHCVAVTRSGVVPPTTLEGLAGMRLAVQQGDIMHEYCIENGLSKQVTLLPDQEAALRAVAEGQADCALVARMPALYWIRENGYKGLEVGTRPIISPRYCIAVRNGEMALLSHFSEGLKSVEESGKYQEMYNRLLGIYLEPTVTLHEALRNAALVLVPLLVILLLVFLWSWSLRREVAFQTQALRSAELLRRAMITCSPVALYTIDAAGNTREWNASAERMFGWTASEIVGKPLSLVPPDKLVEHQELRRRLAEGETLTSVEVERCRKSGERFWGSLSLAPMFDESGNYLGVMGAMEDISERKAAEDALRQSEEQFRSLVEGAPDAIFIQTRWCFSYVNRAAVRLLGAGSEGELLGREVLEFFHPDDRVQVSSRIQRLNEEKRPVELARERMLGVDGTIVEVEVTAVPFRFQGCDGALVFVRDVRDRLKAERELAASEGRFRRAVEEAPLPVMIHAEDGAVLALSSAWTETTGYSESELATTADWARLAYGSRAAEVLVWIQQTYDLDGPHQEGEYEIGCKDGSTRIWDFRSTPLGTLPDGRRVVISMAADVTARKFAEARARHLNRVLLAIRDVNQLMTRERDEKVLIEEASRLLAERRSYVAALIILTDKDGRPVHWASTGTPDNFLLLYEELAAGRLPACCNAARDVMRDSPLIDREAVCKVCPVSDRCVNTKSLCVTLEYQGTVFGYLIVTLDPALSLDREEQDLFVELAADLGYALNGMQERAARIVAEQDRELLQSQLLQSQKMEAVGQLAGGVAHDFNNILQAIMGHAQILLEEVPDQGDWRSSLQEILQGSERAANLTRQLLAFSRRQIMRPEVLDINDLTQAFLKMIRRVIGEDIQLEWLPGVRVGAVYGDRGMLEQVLMNLCVNARDAMPEGGRLMIETHNVRVDSEYCSTHAWAKPGRYTLWTITDTGCGIEETDLEHIFEPFFTTKAEGKGTGLGLATAYGIVKQHEGMIRAYSEVGQGTTFKVYLPICERQAEAVGTLVEGPVRGGRETILLAEDDEMVRALAQTVLVRGGYEVITAKDGEEAVEQFMEHRDAIALLLLDVVMPRLGGRGALDRIREISPEVPVLFSSGYSENAVHTNFVLHEDLELIQKPYSPADLLRAVRRMLDGGDKTA
ncbi:MAG: transporter substrate-binding domain-containing protein [Candidatus Hydrogenedentes bacterium]|nr:transporter substrate-binding domain-containing protein [Candidatus Hydrogenedentota bacterium]